MLQFIQNLRTKFEGTAFAADIDKLEESFKNWEVNVINDYRTHGNQIIDALNNRLMLFAEEIGKDINGIMNFAREAESRIETIEGKLNISGNSHAGLSLTEAGDSETGHEARAIASQNQEAAKSTL